MAKEVTDSVENGKEKNEEVKEGESEETPTELELCIIRQVEYYFGDMNLPRDKFLKEQIELDEGWVPFTTMLKFNRLAALSSDKDVISTALKKSKSQLIEISEDGEKIRRSLDFPVLELNEERRKEIMSRTIYAKGLPKEETTIDDCLKFFAKFGEVENVIMKRYIDKKQDNKRCFKGSVYVTYKTEADAKKFLEEKSVKYNEVELLRLWQSKYLEKKKAEIEEKYNLTMAKRNAKKKEESQQIVLPRGTVLLLKNVPEDLSRDTVKESIKELDGAVAFVKLEQGTAWVRLQKEGTAKTVFEKIVDGKIKIGDSEFECQLPEEDDELKFLDQMASELMEFSKKRFDKNRKQGNRFSNRKRKGRGDNGPQTKRKA